MSDNASKPRRAAADRTASKDARPAGLAGTIPQVVAASRDVYAAIDEVDSMIATKLGVHRSDLRCLNLLEHGPRRPSDIGSALGLTSGAVTALIDRLESAGFAQRARGVGDRRSVQVELPPEAFARVGRLYGAIARALSESFVGLTKAEIDATTQGLSLFAAGCRAGAARIAQEGT